MRIVSGIFKGRIIHPPGHFRGRPTTDMAKEGLFNILSNRFEFQEISVLDLFSGSGNISFEFASRGCVSITSVEKDPFHYRFIRKVISDMDLKIAAIHGDAFQFLKKTQQKFDLIFADPPFDLPELESVPFIVFSGDLLHENGILILEHSNDHDFSSLPQFTGVRKYGHIRFSFFQAG